MIQCEHNANGEFASETNDQEPGERCSNPASVVIHWTHPDTPDQPNIEYRCVIDSAHILLLMDELDANSIDYKVFHLVDVTSAALGADTSIIDIFNGPGNLAYKITWDASNDAYGQMDVYRG
jgi:hypothetical protein